jgi:hypothetical protein
MKYIILIMSVIVMFSCNNNNDGKKQSTLALHVSKTVSGSDIMKQVSSNLTVIDAEKDVIGLDMFEFDARVTDLKYIYLKTKEPIGYIDKVIIHKNRIIISDRISEQIFIFDMDGNLIKIISDKGGGPKEYRGLGDIAGYNENIIVGDRLISRRFYYTLDGEYIQQEKCLPYRLFAPLGDKFILHLGYHQSFTYKITPNLVVSVKDSAIRRALPYHNIQKETFSGNFNYNYKGDLFFTPPVSDTVYQILSEFEYTAKYIIKHKQSVWQKYKEELVHGEISKLIKEGYSKLWTGFYETENNIGFQIVAPKEDGTPINPYWYDKATKQVYNIIPPTINSSEKRFIPPDIIPMPVGVWDNYYIGEIRPEQIEFFREYQKQEKDSIRFKNEELQRIIQLDDDPNQIIVLYKLDFNKKSN